MINRIGLRRFIKDKSNLLNVYDDTELFLLDLDSQNGLFVYLDLDEIYIPFTAVALRFYITGTFHIVVGDTLEILQPTSSRIIGKVSQAIAKLRPRYIIFPTFYEAATARQ